MSLLTFAKTPASICSGSPTLNSSGMLWKNTPFSRRLYADPNIESIPELSVPDHFGSAPDLVLEAASTSASVLHSPELYFRWALPQ